jgi:hypothetical protein
MRADQSRPADVELDAPLVIGDHSPEGHLAARSGSGRNGDEWRDALRQRHAAVLVLVDRTAVDRDDSGGLRRVDRGAASEPDEGVAALLGVDRRDATDELDVGVRENVGEHDRVGQLLERPGGEPRRLDATVGDEQRPSHA